MQWEPATDAKSGTGAAKSTELVAKSGASSTDESETVHNPLTGGSQALSSPVVLEGLKEEKKSCCGRLLQLICSVFEGRESGKDLQQHLTLAINATQLFYLVIGAVKLLLPRLYLDVVLPLAFFSFNLSLALPSLDPEELKWYQLLCNVSFTIGCCLFLWRGDEGEDGYKEPWKVKDEAGNNKQFAGGDIVRVDWTLQLLPWQTSLDHLLLQGGNAQTACLIAGTLAGSALSAVGATCFTDSASPAAMACVVIGAYVTTITLFLLSLQIWLRLERSVMETMFASIKVPAEDKQEWNAKNEGGYIKERGLKEGDNWDEQQAAKHFWARATFELASLAILLLNAIFLPMVQAVVDTVANTMASGELSPLKLCQIVLLLPCSFAVVDVFYTRSVQANKKFKLQTLGHKKTQACCLRQKSQSSGHETQGKEDDDADPAVGVEAYDEAVAAAFGEASTTTSQTKYNYAGQVESVNTNASSKRMIDAAFLKLLVPFQYRYRYVSLGIMAEKVLMVLAARWHGGDPRILSVLTGMGLLFFALTGAYHATPAMRVPRWLGLSSRVSTFLAALVAATHVHLPMVSERLVQYALVGVFAVVATVYLIAFNPFAIFRKLIHKVHLPWAIRRSQDYVPISRPPDPANKSEKWLTAEAPLNCYDTLVISPPQFECVIVNRSTEEGRAVTFSAWLCGAQPSFKAWLHFGVTYRPLLANMKELVLVARGIKALGDAIGELTNLEVLDVHQNLELKALPAAGLAKLTKLKKIDASNCKLTALPESIGKLEALTFLNVRNNALEELPSTIGNLKALATLRLGGNSLSALPRTMSQLKALKELYVASNKLPSTEVDFIIESFPQLTHLGLQNLGLTALPSTLGNLKALEILRLQDNALADSIGELQALTILDLDGNKIAALPSTIGNLKALEDLNVGGNALTALPSTIGNLKALTQLYLARNALTDAEKARVRAALPNCKRLGL